MINRITGEESSTPSMGQEFEYHDLISRYLKKGDGKVAAIRALGLVGAFGSPGRVNAILNCVREQAFECQEVYPTGIAVEDLIRLAGMAIEHGLGRVTNNEERTILLINSFRVFVALGFVKAVDMKTGLVLFHRPEQKFVDKVKSIMEGLPECPPDIVFGFTSGRDPGLPDSETRDQRDVFIRVAFHGVDGVAV